MTDTDPNAFVAGQATFRDELDMGNIVLIGTMGKPGDMSALFRKPAGGILQVREGEATQMGQIFEISDAGVVITRANGNSYFIPPIPIG